MFFGFVQFLKGLKKRGLSFKTEKTSSFLGEEAFSVCRERGS